MSLLTEIDMIRCRWPRSGRPALRIALSTPGRSMSRDQAVLLAQFWCRLAVMAPSPAVWHMASVACHRAERRRGGKAAA